MKILYPAHLAQQDQGYFVQFIDFEEAITEGDSVEEALKNAAEVLTLTLEGRMDEGLEIPTPSMVKDTHLIAPSARVQSALLMRFSRGKKSTSHLARVLQTSWPAAARLEDPHHWPSLRQLERAAQAMGQRLVLSLESAA